MLKRSVSSYFIESPPLLRDFMTYISTIRGKSDQTAREYFLDLRMFLRYMKRLRGLVAPDALTCPLSRISRFPTSIPF